MRLAQILYCQGFGTRRECEALIAHGSVDVQGRRAGDPDEDYDTGGLVLHIDGVEWPFHDRALIVLNKPPSTECSRNPKHHRSVLSLLPPPLRRRGVQPVGRLDADTTGLLLLTDDGALIHRLTSPKRQIPKIYEVGCKHPPDASQLRRLLEGVVLLDDPSPVCAVDAVATGERADGLHGLRLTLTSGKYHQVKRMLAAVGNRVESLHRSGFGSLRLARDLAPGSWRWVDPADAEGASR